MVRVISPPLRALLVTAVRPLEAFAATTRATPLTTVTVTAVARPADRERGPTPHATQQIQEDAERQSLAHKNSMRVDKLRRRWDALSHPQPPPTTEALVAPCPGRREPAGASFVREDYPNTAGAPTARMTIAVYGRLLVGKARFLVAVFTCFPLRLAGAQPRS